MDVSPFAASQTALPQKLMGALQEAVLPPFAPRQFHVQILAAWVTTEAVPALQRFVVGVVTEGVPFALPQVPFMTGQEALEGVVALQVPLHWTVPTFTCPQMFGAEAQAALNPMGFAGVVAEHEPLHWMVPEVVCPQEFAGEVQEELSPTGFEGVVALHEPLH